MIEIFRIEKPKRQNSELVKMELVKDLEFMREEILALLRIAQLEIENLKKQ